MIRDRDAYQRLRVADERQRLASMTAAESLAIGEALWTSSVAGHDVRQDEPRPLNLAIRLGIAGKARPAP